MITPLERRERIERIAAVRGFTAREFSCAARVVAAMSGTDYDILRFLHEPKEWVRKRAHKAVERWAEDACVLIRRLQIAGSIPATEATINGPFFEWLARN